MSPKIIYRFKFNYAFFLKNKILSGISLAQLSSNMRKLFEESK